MAARIIRLATSRFLERDAVSSVARNNYVISAVVSSVDGGHRIANFTHNVANNHNHLVRSQVTIRSSSSSSPPVLNTKKKKDDKRSPHSKLLRVCSERNVNSHFAAIEADFLRLNWQEAMATLVEDWSKKQRWVDFIELESNVRTYVSKNMTDLTYYENEIVQEYHGNSIIQQTMTLEDYIRLQKFPYEKVIMSITQRTGKMKESGNDNAEVHERIVALSLACKLLDAMLLINVNGDENEIEQQQQTEYHVACCNCYRSVVGGWFLLNRRMTEKASAAEILEASTKLKLDIQSKHEMHHWTKKWLSFCSSSTNGGMEDNGDQIQGLLSYEKDRPLLLCVSKLLSMADDDKWKLQSAELMQQTDMLFPEKE